MLTSDVAFSALTRRPRQMHWPRLALRGYSCTNTRPPSRYFVRAKWASARDRQARRLQIRLVSPPSRLSSKGRLVPFRLARGVAPRRSLASRSYWMCKKGLGSFSRFHRNATYAARRRCVSIPVMDRYSAGTAPTADSNTVRSTSPARAISMIASLVARDPSTWVLGDQLRDRGDSSVTLGHR